MKAHDLGSHTDEYVDDWTSAGRQAECGECGATVANTSLAKAVHTSWHRAIEAALGVEVDVAPPP